MSEKKSGDDVGFKDLNKNIWKNPKPKTTKLISDPPAPLPLTDKPEELSKIMINEVFIVGRTVKEAKDYTEQHGYQLCVVKGEADGYFASQLVGSKRVNVEVIDGRISRVLDILS